jgi:hypothetical protein
VATPGISQQVQNEEMKNRLAALQLEKMIDSFQARIDGIALRVDDTNDYWDEYTEDSLTAAGFRREGTTFQKDIVTGSTITSPVIRELREIQQYQDMLYETPDLETASGIRNYGLVYDFDAVQALIANATKVVEAEEERVFGTGVREWRAKGGAWAERDEAPDLSKKKEQEKGWQNRGDGLFGKHVGYAPVYKSGYDVDMEKSRTKNIKYKGSGELGRILGYLSWYNMEEGAGYSQVNQPAWDKPLWDAYPLFGNEDWMMEAPSFAGAVDIVVQVVATVATAPVGGWGGAALGAAIGSVDDLLFTALELGTGYIIPEQALLQVGQTLLKAGVQVAAQGAFQGYEKQAGGLMAAWGKNFMGEATVNFLQQLTTNTLNGAIDAVELSYDDDGNLEGLGFDMERWGESVYGVRALAGYAGSFARSATQSLLKGTAVGFLGEGANNYNALIKTASALAGEGVGSLIDGEFSINVLNLTDILSPFIEDKELLAKMDMGLFSMNFARDKNGNLRTTSRINSAGANVGGLVGLARSVAGLTEAYDNIRIGLSGADEKTAIALRGISTNGQEASQSLFDQILSGETTLQEAYRVAVGEIAKTTSTADGKEISLNMEDLNGFELGVVLAHEAMRNGRNDGKEGQRQETRDSVLAHSAHALEVLKQYGPGALSGRMGQEAMIYAMMQSGEVSREDFEAYIDGSYDSTFDYWRLIVERDENGQIIGGRIEDDGENELTIIDGDYVYFGPLKNSRENQEDRLSSLAEVLGTTDRGLIMGLIFEQFLLSPDSIEKEAIDWELVKGVNGLFEHEYVPVEFEKNPNFSVPFGANINSDLTKFLYDYIRNPISSGTYNGSDERFADRSWGEWSNELMLANKSLIDEYIANYAQEIYAGVSLNAPGPKSMADFEFSKNASSLVEIMHSTFNRPIISAADHYMLRGEFKFNNSNVSMRFNGIIEDAQKHAFNAWDNLDSENVWGNGPIIKRGYEGYILNQLPQDIQSKMFFAETFTNNVNTAEGLRKAGMMAVATRGVQHFVNEMKKVWANPNQTFAPHSISRLNLRELRNPNGLNQSTAKYSEMSLGTFKNWRSYEQALRENYGASNFSSRQYRATIGGKQFNGIADDVVVIDDEFVAIEGKWVGDWSKSLRNPFSKIGSAGFAQAERLKMVFQAQKYVNSNFGRVIYHSNSVDFINYYDNLFKTAGIDGIEWILTR